MAQVSYSAVGRRKKAVARVRLVPGEGNITINKRDIDNYFGVETLKMTVRQPLTLTKAGSMERSVISSSLRTKDQKGANSNSALPLESSML